MKNKFLLILLAVALVFPLVSAGDFTIKYSGNNIFGVDTSGNTNATGWLAENGVIINETYVMIASVSTCGAGEYLTFDGTDWTCDTPTAVVPDNSVNIAGENITSGTIDFARLPNLDDTHTHDYHNLTGMPTCGGSDVLTFDGTDFSCVSGSSADFTNVAYVNETNTFVPQQIFSAGMNVTGYINLQSSASGLNRGGTTATIDDTGNFIITLG